MSTSKSNVTKKEKAAPRAARNQAPAPQEPSKDVPGSGMEEEAAENENNQLAVRQKLPMAIVDVANIHTLDQATVAPIDLMSDYWTPEAVGEFKRAIFDRIDMTPVLSQETNEVFDLECAYFFVREKGAIKQISNGSKRLVGMLQARNIQKGSAVEITYLGKRKNKRNAFHSDNWSVKPLIIDITPSN